ncbi:MAG TPA: fumarylacetoacetate hydrolase family protein [Candidatus Binatia bacterium]|nr:fumarylacetoacetate hydrolase family protein [Candidatus Binatia bacterium]
MATPRLGGLKADAVLPSDAERATLVGRIWDPAVAGPTPVLIHRGRAVDISRIAPTTSALLEMERLVPVLQAASGLPEIAAVEELIANSDERRRDPMRPWLLAPCDLQSVKAAGVTFVASMLERVIEEQARGDASRAEEIRRRITGIIGDNLSKVKPGSAEAARVKEVLLANGAWSQYLEVGIGPDCEIFTKCPPMASVGLGADIGLHPKSQWSNPEPEIVLAANSRGEVMGATLGNDVNLRDFEGRSALLLGKAKDNNASSAIGPFLRLFDAGFTIDDVRQAVITVKVAGSDGFVMEGSSSMAKISRDPLDIAGQALNGTHQYPDGFMLFLGTMFAPIQDREKPGQGFTHHIGDAVSISSPKLGTLWNRVDHSDKIAPWSFGANALMKNLVHRQLVG